MTGFSVTDSTPISRAGFLELTRETLVAPDGSRHERHLVRHPGAVVVVPVLDDGRTALCVRQYRVATGRELLEVPAGKRDVEHELPEETGRRELREEIGRDATDFVLLAEFWNSPGFCTEYSHAFLALGLGPPHATISTSAEEQAMTIEEVELTAIERLIATRDLVDAKTIIGLLLAREHLGGASARHDG